MLATRRESGIYRMAKYELGVERPKSSLTNSSTDLPIGQCQISEPKNSRLAASSHSGTRAQPEYTGRSRPASTLSGGEGFMASLSLALGLSDVVQAYAGGVQLDTLFIDEGFGSLDPESLDMAMKALIDLQQRGRTVGVISHVEEMKQQIDVAIEVVQGVRGSWVRMR